MLWPTWLQMKIESTRRVKYHILTEYRCEAAASVVASHPANESSGGPLPPFHQSTSYRYSISAQEAGNALVLRIFMDGGTVRVQGEPFKVLHAVFAPEAPAHRPEPCGSPKSNGHRFVTRTWVTFQLCCLRAIVQRRSRALDLARRFRVTDS
ncbi:hypothetical protein EVAR_28227_1 [Eumeta japonica]|uniref:Uncharacterized protein n=1 Tax=Eumeta variegata TaxID=151549 RepID=A0A4C1V7V4_EUMVA|nr:hypothetical protein EVAR_28227_1 [Eumeta japonica]